MKKCLEFIRTFFYLTLDFGCYLSTRKRYDSQKKKVLIIRLDGIGDFILWLDSIKGLRTLFPPNEYTISLVVSRPLASLAGHLDYFDEILSVELTPFNQHTHEYLILEMPSSEHAVLQRRSVPRGTALTYILTKSRFLIDGIQD